MNYIKYMALGLGVTLGQDDEFESGLEEGVINYGNQTNATYHAKIQQCGTCSTIAADIITITDDTEIYYPG